MSNKLVVGLDGEQSGENALNFARKTAKAMGSCELIIAYVIEWSPFTFQTAEENAARHKRREEEISIAQSRVVQPAVDALNAAGFDARGVVRHGNVADTLNAIATEQAADQIIVARSSAGGITKRIFGSSTATLVMNATVPVTVVA